jgi:hypothetical protein
MAEGKGRAGKHEPGMLLGRRRNAWFEYLQEDKHKVKKNPQIDE